MALRTHFEQTKIGCPGVAEFTVQRPEALFDHITGFRQIPVTLGLYSGLTLNQYGVASPCRTICTVFGFVALF